MEVTLTLILLQKLRRAIAESRGQSGDRPLLIKNTSTDGSYRSDDSAQAHKARQTEPHVPGAAGISTKRKYRRHPKRDEHAPERPPSAYVIFLNLVRETVKYQELCFTAIAKVVGERWQVLPANSREAYERQAMAAKERYYAGLAEYKKTPQYDTYQKYLEEFRAKHAATQKGITSTEGKRPKLETDTDTSTSGIWSRSDEQVDRLPKKRVSSAQPGVFAISHHRAEANPPIGPLRLPSGPSYPPISTTLAAYSLSRLNSPRVGDQYPPFDLHTSAMAYDARGHTDPSMPYPSTPYSHPLHHTSSTTPPAAYGSQYQAHVDLPLRMSFREPARLPPLIHEYTTLSFSGGDGEHKTAFPGPSLLVIDAQKSMRMLPLPVPSPRTKPSPLDRHPLPVSSPASNPQQHPNLWTNSSLTALLRPGELARKANEEDMEKEGLP